MTQVGQNTSMVVDMCERYDTGRSVYKHGSRHVCVETYDTGRSVYKHGSRHVCVERYDTGRSVYKHGSRHVSSTQQEEQLTQHEKSDL